MSKRRRTESGFSTKRPIDKQLFSTHDSVTASQSVHSLVTAQTSGTVTGLRWTLNSNAAPAVYWAIVLVRGGQSASTISIPGAGAVATLYAPEQDVLAHGIIDDNNSQWGESKTMRKLKSGDKIELLLKGSGAGPAAVYAAVQFFIKE